MLYRLFDGDQVLCLLLRARLVIQVVTIVILCMPMAIDSHELTCRVNIAELQLLLDTKLLVTQATADR